MAIARIVQNRVPESLAGINFAKGRGGCPFPVDAVVIHCTEGNAASVRDWFTNPRANDGAPSEVSAHYLVTRAGGIEQFVDEADRAYHAGKLVDPTNELTVERYGRGKWTPNSWSIGIEHEAITDRQELTDVQREASYKLLADIIGRYKIPVDRRNIIAHHEIRASKTCPGAIDVDRIVADLAAMLGTSLSQSAEQPAPDSNADHPLVVWSPHLNEYIAVARYIDDTHWYYVRFSDMQTRAKRAGAALSAFPLTKPEANP